MRRATKTAGWLAAGAGIYIGAYLTICQIRPEWTNTNDGPKKPFLLLFLPLRHLSAEAPDFFVIAEKQGCWLTATIEEINPGNGYLYFTWAGGESRAFLGVNAEGFRPGDSVRLHFRSELQTYEDFRSHRIPSIDDLKPAIDPGGRS